MAVSAAAALLDELMGRDRNDSPNDQKKPVDWEDPEFCEYFMVKFCPHDLFVNTRVDIGPCPKLHCEDAKTQYNEEASSDSKMQYENMFVKFASTLLKDVDRHNRKGKRRLMLESEKLVSSSNSQSRNNQDQIELLSKQINELVQKAEQMGTQGYVEEAQGLVKLCDQLKEKRDTLRKQNESIDWSQKCKLAAVKKKKATTVCDVCGAILVISESNLTHFVDHLTGKQHVGYDLLNKAVDEMQLRREKRRVEKLKKQREEEEKKHMDLIKSYSKSVNRHSRNPNNDKRSKSSRDRSHHRINRISERHERERRRSRSRSDCRSSNSPRHRGHNGDSCKDH